MSNAISVSSTTAGNMLKEIYGGELTKIVSAENLFIREYPMQDSEGPGLQYSEGIAMTMEQGFTGRDPGEDDTDMNDPVPLRIEKATVLGKILEFRSRITLELMMRSLSSKRAFKDGPGLRVEAMRDSTYKHLEWTCLWGTTPIGIVESIAAGSGASQKVLTLTNAEWSGGFWAGMENMPIDVYDVTGVTKRTANNTQTTKAQVAVINSDTRAVTINFANSTDAGNVVVGDYLWRFNMKGKESMGLIPILLAQSGTVNGISATDYGLWRGVTSAVNGQINMSAFLNAAARTAERGQTKGEVKAWTGPGNFAVLNADMAATRRFDGSYSRKKGTNGFGEIEYASPTGIISLQTHTMMKNGYTVIFPKDKVKRVGPTDVTFEYQGREIFRLLENKNQFEYRAFSQQGVLVQAPARCAVLTGLTQPAA